MKCVFCCLYIYWNILSCQKYDFQNFGRGKNDIKLQRKFQKIQRKSDHILFFKFKILKWNFDNGGAAAWKSKEKKNNHKNSGHFVPMQRLRAAHTLHSEQKCFLFWSKLFVLFPPFPCRSSAAAAWENIWSSAVPGCRWVWGRQGRDYKDRQTGRGQDHRQVVNKANHTVAKNKKVQTVTVTAVAAGVACQTAGWRGLYWD